MCKLLDATKKDEFVSLFPANRKSGICNKILEKIRAGKDYSPEIARIVIDGLNRYPDDNGDLLFILRNNTLLFMDAIDYYIEYEKLSHVKKEELRRFKSKEYIELNMGQQSISKKQIWKLNKLGYEGTYDLTKLEASRKIEELL